METVEITTRPTETKRRPSRQARGMSVPRRYTRPGVNPLDEVEYEKRRSVIANPDGSIVFQMDDAEVPKDWTQLATDVVVSKYFRKAGVPGTGRETSVRQLVHRVAHTIRRAGEEQGGYFATPADADAFEAELAYLLVHQYGAFNSPVWFNCGLWHEYGILGSGGNYAWDEKTQSVFVTEDSYSRPQVSACFIQSVNDDLMSIFELLRNEARVFKFGSGTGTNYSKLRGRMEKLSGGGTSSGLMSFLEVFDRGAGATKSGGTTRRAAKMVVLDMDHPEIVDFITWKQREEKKARALIAAGYPADFNGEAYHTVSGQNSNNSVRVTDAFMRAVIEDGTWQTTLRTTGEVHETFRARDLWHKIAEAAWSCADPGVQYDDTIQKWHTCKATDRIRATNPCSEFVFLDDTACFAPETRISTPEGLRTVEELFRLQEQGGRVLVTTDLHSEHDHRRVTAHRPALVTRIGDRPVVRIDFQDGRSIRVTPDHRFLVPARGWVRADELVVGEDCVAIRESGNPVRFASEPADLERWRLLGWLTADGVFAQETGTLVFSPPEPETAMRIEKELDRLRQEAEAGPRERHRYAPSSGLQPASARAAALVEYLQTEYGLRQGSAIRTDLPGRVHEVADDLKVAYLQGLFSAAGSLRSSAGATEPEVLLSSSSPALLRGVQLLLSDLGIVSQIRWTHPGGHRHPQGQLRIGHRQARKFLAIVGFPLSPQKSATAAEVLASPSGAEPESPLPVRVASIEPDGVETVYDITEPVTHSVIAEGLIAHNCNLASVNLLKFLRDDGTFDIESYRHTCRIFFLAQEILVDLASYPTKKIAERSHQFRPLGLGYANLGTLLMVRGIPYDSDEARAWAAAITAIMTGEAYAESAEMAAAKGPFEGFPPNRESMLEVMRLHRDAAYAIDARLCPEPLRAAAIECWDRALALGEQYGYRNAQATVLAPTGCLVGGSLVPTERGLVRLRSLGDPDGEKWQALGIRVGTDEGPRVASQFFVNGLEPVVTIETSRGYRIEGTPTHRIKVVGEDGQWVWKRFAEIEEDDLVPLALNPLVGEPQDVPLPPLPETYGSGEQDLHAPQEMSAELAEIVGYFMGGGSLHPRGLRFRVSAQDGDVVERIRALARRLFGAEVHVAARAEHTEVAIHSARLVLWWKACGFANASSAEGHAGEGFRAHLPDAVLHSNDRQVYAAFLRGLFEAGGTVMPAGCPAWSTPSLSFSRDVQQLLLALGYPTARKMETPAEGQSPLAVLRLLDLSLNERWLGEIGFISARKRGAVRLSDVHPAARTDRIPVPRGLIDRLTLQDERLRPVLLRELDRDGAISRRIAEELQQSVQDPELGRRLSFFYDRVVTADLGAEQLTYDLSVPDNVTYIANGFVSHNTIGLLMDCDTTGIEPDFAMVKFKKLAGGGYFKIVNQSVPRALKTLGYADREIEEIVRYAVGTGSLVGAPHVNRASLLERGLTEEEIRKIEAVLPAVLDLRNAFTVHVLGEACLRRLGVAEGAWKQKGWSLLAHLGFDDAQVAEASAVICGRMTVEGAPGLKPEHLPVFDCANRCGTIGRRFIEPMGHVKMMAAVQPFISGAISKTVNLPADSTVEDVERIYMEGWKLGLKAIALYRDGSKASQPLSTSSEEKPLEKKPEARAVAVAPTPTAAQGTTLTRKRLPKRRHGWTQEAIVGGHKVFLRTGEYEDGRLGEIFIDMHKEGAAYRSMMNCFAIAVSMGLQYGVPLEALVDQFTFTRFEPQGPVEGHPNVKFATSIIDYIFRVLGFEYLGRTDLVQVQPEELARIEAKAKVDALPRPVAEPAAAQPAAAEPAVERAAPSGVEKAPSPAAAPRKTGNGHDQVAAGRGPGDLYKNLLGDAPFCDVCGHITVRNASCYRCLNCGHSMGCS